MSEQKKNCCTSASDLRQTNNTAELLAAIRALQIFTCGKMATDSEYVFLGATGAARRWQLKGWVGSKGPVSNVPLWKILLGTLRTHQGSIKFVKVPSHVNIIGNNQADHLADQCRLSHPLCPVFHTPERQVSADETPPRVQTFNQSPQNSSFLRQNIPNLADRKIFSRMWPCGWAWSCFRAIGRLHCQIAAPLISVEP